MFTVCLNGKLIISRNYQLVDKNNQKINLVVNFANGDQVVDEVRGYLIYSKSQWCFVGINQYNIWKTQNNKKLKKLVLILESPHKDEYSSNYQPLRPANGQTGKKINTRITSRQFIQSLTSDFDYQVFLMNPIQFQCSCSHHFEQYSIPTPPKVTKQVFKELFDKLNGNLREDFMSRLQNYNPDFVLNACTYGLRDKIVKDAIDEALKNRTFAYKNDTHPSTW